LTPWWLGLSSAQATVRCGEHQHRVRWDKGRLQALDHDDPEAERALAALGGEPFACIELLDAWERHKDNPRALVLGSRGPTDLLQIDPDMLPQLGGGGSPARQVGRPGAPRPRAGRGITMIGGGGGGGGWAGYAPRPTRRVGARASKQARSEAELIWLLSLGGGIADRLLATVSATWSRRISSGQAGLNKALPQLHAALHGRTFASLRAWLGEPALAAELIMIGATQPRSLARFDDRLRADLPFSWLVEVWARDLTTIYGRFCLAAESTNGRQWRLSTISPNLRDTEIITVNLPT
jgi:hypothetical protein